MTIAIDEAIKTLSDSANSDMTTFNEKYKQAQLLGIEALKREQHRRKYDIHLPRELLPGETRSI